MSLTKDEHFMLKLYEEASKREDLYEPLDKYFIGKEIGLQEKAVDTICKTLMRTNFIKQHSMSEISITPNGVRLVEQLREGH